MWNTARRLLGDYVPSQIKRRRGQRINLILISPELHVELGRATGDHDCAVGRIIAGSGDTERTRSEARQSVAGCHSSDLNQLVVRWPNRTAWGGHSRNHGWCLVNIDLRYSECAHIASQVRT